MGAWSYLEEGSQVKIWWINTPSVSLVPLSGQREGQHGWRVVSEEETVGEDMAEEAGRVQLR